MSINVSIGIGLEIGVQLAGRGGDRWTTVEDSSDSAILSGQDAVVAVYDGANYLYFGKSGATWKLLWVDRNGALLRGDAAGATPVTVASDGPSPFGMPYGLATDRLAGGVSVGTTFSHEADCVIEWTLDTLPSASLATVQFRRQDASNLWDIRMNNDGYLYLNEIASGTFLRGSAAGASASGYRFVVVMEGSTIRVYSNNVLRFTYSSATNLQTVTSGRVAQLGTGGAISDLITWPRTLPAGAAALLDGAIA